MVNENANTAHEQKESVQQPPSNVESGSSETHEQNPSIGNGPPHIVFHPIRRFKAWLRHPKRERPKWTDISIVFLTCGIVILAGVQVYEMIDSGKQTNKIIAADERLAKANERFATAMENTVTQSQGALDRTLVEMQKQSKAMQDSANAASSQTSIGRQNLDASNRQNKESLDATIKNARLDERPWITISNFQMSGEPEDKKEITIRCAVTNSGKTPALSMIPQSRLILADFVPAMTKFPEPQSADSRSIVAPGPTTVSFTTKPWTIDDERISQYTKKEAALYLHALIRYVDSSGNNHWTSVCALHNNGAPLNEFQYCERGNEMDKEGGPTIGVLPN